MISLVYVSAATKLLDAAAMDALLATCRRNNARLGVTGALSYFDGSFMQALEGEAATVDALYQRIAADKRHRSVTQMLRLDITERAFPTWHMEVVPSDFVRMLPSEDLRSMFAAQPEKRSSMARFLLDGFRRSFEGERR